MTNKEGFLKYLFAANATNVRKQDYVSCVLFSGTPLGCL